MLLSSWPKPFTASSKFHRTRWTRKNKRQFTHLSAVELLEDRTLLSVTVESFDDGDFDEYTGVQSSLSSVSVTAAAAHDGPFGLQYTGQFGSWMFRDDATVHVEQGDVLSVWTRGEVFAEGEPGGRGFFGFGATASGTLAMVMAPNTGELLLQVSTNRYKKFHTIGSAPQTWQADHWYQMEVTWETSGAITGRLYDSDGATLLNTVTATSTAITSGGIGFRSFESGKYFDTVEVLKGGAAGPPSFSISDVTVNEADGTATFTVTRSGDTSNTDTVNFATADGPSTDGAIAPGDYFSFSGTLTFDPGVPSLPVQVTIVDDLDEESAETFFVNLINPSIGTSISDGQGVGTILDNDGPAGGSDDIYVLDIDFDTRLRGKGGSKHDERIVVTILRDADADGVDLDDVPVAGATVTVEVSTNPTDPASVIATLSGTTDAAGAFTSSYLTDLPDDTYTAEVVALTHLTFLWNGALDPTANDGDADGDTLPDEQHVVPHAAASSTHFAAAAAITEPEAMPTFNSFSTSNGDSPSSASRTNDPVVPIAPTEGPALPNDEEASDDDALTNHELTDEEPTIDDEAVDNLFADLDETLLDDLLAV